MHALAALALSLILLPNGNVFAAGNLMPGLTCAGVSSTASSVGYLPRFSCHTGRASTGTYFDAAGVLKTAAANIPRASYHPLTHAFQGILLEKASANQIRSSTAFNGGFWTPNQSPVFGTTTAPDGGTAVTIAKSNTTNHIGAYNFTAGTGSTTYTFSGFVKRISGTSDVKVGPDNLGGANDAVLAFNPGTGALISHGAGASNVSISDVGNGWFRWVVTGTSSAGVTNLSFVVYLINGPGEVAFWGVQRELGSVATSYIPTTNNAVSRAADTYQDP